MRRRSYLIVALIALVLGFLGRALFYYQGVYSGPEVPTSEADRFEVLSEPLSTPLPVEAVVTTILVDNAHRNNFDEQELAILFGRIAAAGGRVEVLRSGANLQKRLRSAGAFLVVANQRGFGADQVRAVEEFVRKGGRLLFVGDPTRLDDVNSINSLAGRFGITYQDDYLYNLVDNDGNYLNVILRDFESSDITRGVDKIVFQTAHSLRVREGAIVMGDENTFSSLRERPGDVTAVALTTDDRVLALPDLTSLTGPFNTFGDNDRFIDNVVRFLLTSERTFDLLDFPFFFSTPTDVVYTDTRLLDATFEDATALRETLRGIGAETALQSELDDERALIFLGLYDDVDDEVLALLEADGITITDEPLAPEGEDDSSVESRGRSQGQITLEGVGSLERGGTTLFHLHRAEDGPYQLYLLATDEIILSDGLALLLEDKLTECMVTPVTALCALAELEEELPEEEDEAGEEEGEEEEVEGMGVLVVSDDAGSPGAEGKTSAGLIRDALSADFSVTVVSTRVDGVPSPSDMLSHSVVFWSIGDYCCLAPSEDGAAALMEYLDSGGALFISGANLGTDWAGSLFFETHLGALDIGDAAQVDLQPDSHPIANFFEDTIQFEPSASDIILDVIDTDVASIAFRRGLDSEFAGEPALIANERGGSRVAYAAFPLYFLPEDDLDLLVQNALDWLSSGE